MTKEQAGKTTISDELRTAIQRDERTAYAIAKQAGVSPSLVTQFVAGERDIRLETAAELARVLGLQLKPLGGDPATSREPRRRK